MSDRIKDESRNSTGELEGLANRERREVLKKMGKYAAYTAPAVVAVLVHKEGRANGVGPAPAG